jgi:hypothetical protein
MFPRSRPCEGVTRRGTPNTRKSIWAHSPPTDSQSAIHNKWTIRGNRRFSVVRAVAMADRPFAADHGANTNDLHRRVWISLDLLVVPGRIGRCAR